VTGTGEPGTGIEICAIKAINEVPPTIKRACVRALLRGATTERRVIREFDIFPPANPSISCARSLPSERIALCHEVIELVWIKILKR
jgi:hypothetical protein